MVRQCNFCCNPDAGYVCPKCGLVYCSLNCYRHRDHLECSENFYKDLVLQELASDNEANKRMKEATLKLLEKMRLNEEPEQIYNQLLSDSKNSQSTRSSSALISPITDEYGLPIEERAKFDKLVQSGGIFNLLPAHFWDPWYIQFSQSLILKDQSSNSGSDDLKSNINDPQNDEDQSDDYEDIDEDEEDNDIPSYPTNLPKLGDIINKEPSPLIKCSLVQTIFAYATICRYFVGSHHSYPVEPYDLLMKLSSLNSSRVSFPETGQCLQFASRYLIEHNKMPLLFIEKLYFDTSLIIKQGNRLVLRCLVDIVQLCKGAKKRQKDKSDEINKIIKKMKFYMSWCLEKEKLYQAELTCIQFEALSFKQLVVQNCEINSAEQQSSSGEANKSDRKLIQIIDSSDDIG